MRSSKRLVLDVGHEGIRQGHRVNAQPPVVDLVLLDRVVVQRVGHLHVHHSVDIARDGTGLALVPRKQGTLPVARLRRLPVLGVRVSVVYQLLLTAARCAEYGRFEDT